MRGRRYLDYPMKYHAEDVGLRNQRLGFRKQEETHLMENIVYNELIRRGYTVDVGVVDIWGVRDGKRVVNRHEIDFVVEPEGARRLVLRGGRAERALRG